MVRCRVSVQNDSHKIPIVPDDQCWCIDGRVFVKFQESNVETLIGTVEGDTSFPGCRNMNILYVPHPYEFIVEVEEGDTTCLLCKGRKFVGDSTCSQCRYR